MHAKNCLALSLSLLLMTVLGGCCGSGALPPAPAEVAMQPGHYLKEFFVAPGFEPGKAAYQLEPFTLEEARGVAPDTFRPIFQTELARAWEANGLKSGPPPEACRVSGAIHLISLQGTRLRFLLGRICAQIIVSGTITQNGRTLFAFRDRFTLESPVNPGAPAPREAELLLQKISQALAHHLLDELLLHGAPADSG